MYKLLSEETNWFIYLSEIEGKKYKIQVSKNGQLMDISRYNKQSEISSKNTNRIEFG